MKLLVATHNRGKLAEFARLLGDLDIEWLTLDDVGITADVEETATSFAENAILKATTYARTSRMMTLADDSGLMVDALDGRPGVLTARYGGPGLTIPQRYQLVLDEMQDVAWEERTARFHCALALAGSDGAVLGTVEGVCPGRIAWEPAGEHGFGYDPIFFLPGLGCTMAQLAPEDKRLISHRGEALRAIRPLLQRLVATEA